MDILGFARDFGLVLFVYAIGVRVGPGFFAAFRREGALLNAFAFCIVLMGGLIAVGIHFTVGLPLEVVTGLFAGGTTNTPSMAAAQQMLSNLHATAGQVAVPGLLGRVDNGVDRVPLAGRLREVPQPAARDQK